MRTPAEVRAAIRARGLDEPTAALAPGFAQATTSSRA
jgi:uncharacterized protein YcsI (UPF0317 family)